MTAPAEREPILVVARRLADAQDDVDAWVDQFRLHPRLPRQETSAARSLALRLQEVAAAAAAADGRPDEREAVATLAKKEADLVRRLRREADVGHRTGIDPRWEQVDLHDERATLMRLLGLDPVAAPASGRPMDSARATPSFSTPGFATVSLRDRLTMIAVGVLIFVVYVAFIVLRTYR